MVTRRTRFSDNNKAGAEIIPLHRAVEHATIMNAVCRVTLDEARNTAVVAITGEIDLVSIPSLETAIDQARAAEPDRVLIDANLGGVHLGWRLLHDRGADGVPLTVSPFVRGRTWRRES